jgi:hypothetical protein
MDDQSVDAFDVSGQTEVAPGDLLKSFKGYVAEAISLQTFLAETEASVTAAKAMLHDLRTRKIPDIMEQIAIGKTEVDGYTVEVSEIIAGSMHKEPTKRAAAIAYLEANEAAGLIKSELVVTFAKEFYEAAVELKQKIDELNTPSSVQLDLSVHAQSLCAWAREAVREGKDVDFDVLGLYTGKVAKIEPVKESKAKKGKAK